LVSLVDIVPQTRTVQLASGALKLHGLGLRQIASLFLQFPGLRNLVVEGAPELDPVELIVILPEAIGVIIAEAADQPEAVDAILNGGRLTPEDVIECLTVVRDLTFPRGARPLLELIAALSGRAGGPPGKAPDMSMPQTPSNSLARDTIPAL
jgi:hypothetical protein